jgi:hypothetical protein
VRTDLGTVPRFMRFRGCSCFAPRMSMLQSCISSLLTVALGRARAPACPCRPTPIPPSPPPRARCLETNPLRPALPSDHPQSTMTCMLNQHFVSKVLCQPVYVHEYKGRPRTTTPAHTAFANSSVLYACARVCVDEHSSCMCVVFCEQASAIWDRGCRAGRSLPASTSRPEGVFVIVCMCVCV